MKRIIAITIKYLFYLCILAGIAAYFHYAKGAKQALMYSGIVVIGFIIAIFILAGIIKCIIVVYDWVQKHSKKQDKE